jgi:hypothetical protein
MENKLQLNLEFDCIGQVRENTHTKLSREERSAKRARVVSI